MKVSIREKIFYQLFENSCDEIIKGMVELGIEVEIIKTSELYSAKILDSIFYNRLKNEYQIKDINFAKNDFFQNYFLIDDNLTVTSSIPKLTTLKNDIVVDGMSLLQIYGIELDERIFIIELTNNIGYYKNLENLVFDLYKISLLKLKFPLNTLRLRDKINNKNNNDIIVFKNLILPSIMLQNEQQFYIDTQSPFYNEIFSIVESDGGYTTSNSIDFFSYIQHKKINFLTTELKILGLDLKEIFYVLQNKKIRFSFEENYDDNLVQLAQQAKSLTFEKKYNKIRFVINEIKNLNSIIIVELPYFYTLNEGMKLQEMYKICKSYIEKKVEKCNFYNSFEMNYFIPQDFFEIKNLILSQNGDIIVENPVNKNKNLRSNLFKKMLDFFSTFPAKRKYIEYGNIFETNLVYNKVILSENECNISSIINIFFILLRKLNVQFNGNFLIDNNSCILLVKNKKITFNTTEIKIKNECFMKLYSGFNCVFLEINNTLINQHNIMLEDLFNFPVFNTLKYYDVNLKIKNYFDMIEKLQNIHHNFYIKYSYKYEDVTIITVRVFTNK